MSAPTDPSPAPDARAHTARDPDGYRDKTEEYAVRASRANGEVSQPRTQISDLKALNPACAQANDSGVAGHFVFKVLLVGSFWIDYLLFGAVAEYFAMSVFGAASWLVGPAKVPVPLAILAFVCHPLLIFGDLGHRS